MPQQCVDPEEGCCVQSVRPLQRKRLVRPRQHQPRMFGHTPETNTIVTFKVTFQINSDSKFYRYNF